MDEARAGDPGSIRSSCFPSQLFLGCLQTEPSSVVSAAPSRMGENDEGDIIEHHVEEEMEKKAARSHALSSPLLESISPSDREGHSGTQSSHRLLAYSDALISIIATVMVSKPTGESTLNKPVVPSFLTLLAVYLNNETF